MKYDLVILAAGLGSRLKSLTKKIPKANILIHLASITNAEKSFENRKEVERNNLNSFKNVVEYCIKHKSKLVHISSTSVYGPQKNMVDENEKKLFDIFYNHCKYCNNTFIVSSNLV